MLNGRDGERPRALAAAARPANSYPQGREPGQTVLHKIGNVDAPRTMTEDGRALDARPGTPVADEVAAAPEADAPEVAKSSGAGLDLGVNLPNPFDRTTRITFTLPQPGTASLVLFDVRGREVATLFEGVAEAGAHTVTLDASGLASGTYVYVLDVDGERISRRLQVAR